MPGQVERDSAIDSGLLYPRPKRVVYHRAFECLEHKSLFSLTTKCESFLADWESGFLIGLFRADSHNIPVFGLDDMFPPELLNVADTEPRHAREQRRTTQHLMFAWSRGEFLNLVEREEFDLGILPLNLFEEVIDVLSEELLLIRLFEQSAEG